MYLCTTKTNAVKSAPTINDIKINMEEQNVTMSGALSASLEATLAIEMFLNENYRFRRNTLNGKVEYATLPKADVFRPLTKEALNSIVIRAKREQMIEEIRKSYPSLSNTIGNKVKLGKTIKALGFKHKERAHISYYDVMPIRVA